MSKGSRNRSTGNAFRDNFDRIFRKRRGCAHTEALTIGRLDGREVCANCGKVFERKKPCPDCDGNGSKPLTIIGQPNARERCAPCHGTGRA